MTEQVLCIPTKSLKLEMYKPLRIMNEEQLAAWLKLHKKDFTILKRDIVEKDPNFKHLINYIFLYKRSTLDLSGSSVKDNTNYFVYERTKKGNEERLHNNLSIGVGGHIGQITKSDILQSIKEYLRQELLSEIEINQSHSYTYQRALDARFYGLLNDNSNDVGRVHLGLVWSVGLRPLNPSRTQESGQPLSSPGDRVEVREDKLVAKGFWTRDRLLSNLSQFESWSQLLIQSFPDCATTLGKFDGK
jgi:predicted NUDIX family phosphoesterase